jgi:hypothetical protein
VHILSIVKHLVSIFCSLARHLGPNCWAPTLCLPVVDTVHANLGPDGPSASTCGLCGSMLVDFKVDVGRFFVAEGRAGLGQVKHVAFPFFKIGDSINENRV